VVPSDSYVSQLCIPGSSSSLGSDTLFSVCSTTVASGYYVTALCYPGDGLSSLGSDLALLPCSTSVSSGILISKYFKIMNSFSMYYFVVD
jgi:hypothetical protein